MDFQGMKRKKLQVLCKKHGIPANLKNVEMANRLASLFQEDQTTPVRFKTMSDILSRCSVIESQQVGASVNDESLVGKKTDETLVTSEYNTENITSQEMEISKVGCMSVDHCVSKSELGMPTEINDDSLKKNEPTVSSERGCKVIELEVSSAIDELDVFTTPERSLMMVEQLTQNGKTLAGDSVNTSDDVVFTTPEQVLLLGDSVVDEVTDGEQRNEPVSHLYVRAGTDGEENMTVEMLHCESGTITSPNRHALLKGFVSENSGGSKVMELHEEESVLLTGLEERNEFLGEGEIKNQTPKESELEEAAKSEENKALEMQVDCNNIICANKNAKCHDTSDVVTASAPHTAGKQDREEVVFKDESAFFTKFETCLLLGESTQDRIEESSPFTYIHHDQINNAFEELAITDELVETKVTTKRDDKEILMLDSSCVSSVSEKEDEHFGL